MVHLTPDTGGCKHEPDDEDTVQAIAAIESGTQTIQRKNNEFELQFAGRLSLRTRDCNHLTEFQQDWRTVADPSFEHLTFGTNSTAQQANTNVDDDPDAIKTFACPFLKHDPTKYKSWKCCNTWNGWPTVPRIKEHLYRKHLLPKNMCARCREHYQSDDELVVHLRNDPPCENRDMEPHDWIDVATEKKLRARAREPNQSDEVKWTKMYKLLFPEDASTPSPCMYELLPLQVESIQTMSHTIIVHERSLGEYNARFKAELNEYLRHDFSRASRSSFMEMFTSSCNENNGVPDPEKIFKWMQDFAQEGVNSFTATSSTSADQESTRSPGLPSHAPSLQTTGTTTADSVLGYSSQTSFRHNQQVAGIPSNSNIDPQYLSLTWGNSPSIGDDTTQFNVGSYLSTYLPGGME
ncbi:unnamed protein product [Clonostachys rosea]|uniref:C2H2-type domain-containing protein n=1 Tax=Bionectria ochroleuca TaxID=29856 RepID=A0ABY6U4T5_BIOOC|nr:unnamed protein product [Clonostachys rosea]